MAQVKFTAMVNNTTIAKEVVQVEFLIENVSQVNQFVSLIQTFSISGPNHSVAGVSSMKP
jgi:hypothetical protein